MIRVSDNGPGMTPERLAAVRRDMTDQNWQSAGNESLGLQNLYARLKLMFDERADMVIESVLGEGTDIHIILPYEPGGETHVQGTADR